MKKVSVIVIILFVMMIGIPGKWGDSPIIAEGNHEEAVLQVPAASSPGYSLPGKTILRCLYYDQQAFKESYSQANKLSESQVNALSETLLQPSGAATLQGGILPHHLVASPMIARFFAALKTEESEINLSDPETIILLAPNHKRIGDRPLHTGAFSWETPFGQLEADVDMVNGLIRSLEVGVNPILLEEEHAIAALIPYIRHTFPKAKIVPILIHGNTGREDCKALSEFLIQKALDKPCLILASIDFSHGLKPEEALKRDETTRRVMAARDYDTLFGLDNTYLDAPPTLATFLMTMDGLKEKEDRDAEKDSDQGDLKYAEGTLLDHSEASRFLKRRVPDTTSYMTWLFTAKPSLERP